MGLLPSFIQRAFFLACRRISHEKFDLKTSSRAANFVDGRILASKAAAGGGHWPQALSGDGDAFDVFVSLLLVGHASLTFHGFVRIACVHFKCPRGGALHLAGGFAPWAFAVRGFTDIYPHF